MANVTCLILGGLTVLLTICIIALIVKMKKLQTGTVDLEFVAQPLYVHFFNMMESMKHKVNNDKQSRPLSFAIQL